MTTSLALFDCPHCIDEFAFDDPKVAKLTFGWQVRVRRDIAVVYSQAAGQCRVAGLL
jgi:hypothetical protein